MKQQGMSCGLKNVHIGAAIKAVVDRKKMKYSEFASLIHCERATVYHLFKCKSIDTERLLLISEVLNHDFIHELYFPDYCKKNTNPTTDLSSGQPSVAGNEKAKLYIAVELPENHPAIESLPTDFLRLVKK